MKNRNNKGFSLVELIVVVAIMAVLVGVLAPAYLKYVEKSRIQKDVSAIGEVVNAIEIALADEDINTDTTTVNYAITGGVEKTFSASATAKLEKELASTIEKINLTSNGLKGKTVTIYVENAGGKVTIKVVPGTGVSTDVVSALQKLDEYSANS